MKHEIENDLPTDKADAMFTRRGLFEFAGMTLATVALHPLVAMAKPLAGQETESQGSAQGVSPIMERLSTYMSQAGERALPVEVVEKVKQHILDTFAAMISGSELLPGRAALKFIRPYGGKEVA